MYPAVRNVRKMPIEVAFRFLTSVSDLDSYILTFQEQGLIDEFRLLHLLQDHKMAIARSQDEMTVFVSTSQQSLSEIVDFFRLSMSETGDVLKGCPNSSVAPMFGDERLRNRFYTGLAKLTTHDDLFDRFGCACPQTITWFPKLLFPGGPEPDAIMTLFMNSVIDMSGEKPPQRSTLWYYMHKLDGRGTGVTKNDLPKLPSIDYSKFRKRGTIVMLNGTPLPPLELDDCIKSEFDTEGLYRWSLA